MAVIIFLLFLLICAVIWPGETGALISLAVITGLGLAAVCLGLAFLGGLITFFLSIA
jgi:hypothetical protein